MVRRGSIPKATGQERPRGIPALEDQLVQLAGAKLWTASYEQDFRECRDGYRPGHGAWDAVRDRTCDLPYGRYGYLVEANLQGGFDQMDHAWLLDLLRGRSDDRAVLQLIRKWVKAGGGWRRRDRSATRRPGHPQGGTVSPVLANVYLHYALALWFDTVVKAHGQGEALVCRYADDWVGACRYQDDAERCSRVLPQRLQKFNLQVAPEKPPLRRLSRLPPA